MKLAVVLFTLFQIAEGIAFMAVAFLVLMLLLMLAGLTVSRLTGVK